MLQVSERARSLLSELLDDRPATEQIFRLSKSGDGYTLDLSEAAEGDVMFRHDEADVLAVSPDVVETLDGLTIDREDSPGGPRLLLVE